jgi:hypothetical protein
LRRVSLLVASVLVLGGAAVARGSEAACPSTVLNVRGTNPSLPALSTLLAGQAAEHHIPAQVLKAIAYRESTWRQFTAEGKPVISQGDSVCGIGIMQVTLGSRTDGMQLARDVVYNVSEGAKILAQKWADVNTVSPSQPHPAPNGFGPDDPHVLENWYAPICRYNGCSGTDADLAYAEPVSRLVGDPFQQGVPPAIIAHMPPAGFTTPRDAKPSFTWPGEGFQAQHDPVQQFVFYNGSTGDVTSTVPAPTHLDSAPFAGYGAGTYGPDGPNVSCVDCSFWRLAEGTGIAGWAHWTLSRTGSDAAKVLWTPPRTGVYDVSVYVPALGAEALATAVTYHAGTYSKTIDQNALKGTWVSLGRRSLSATTPLWVGDHSDASGVKIVADAVRMKAVTTLSLTSTAATVVYGHATTLTARLAQSGGPGLPGRTVHLWKRPVAVLGWSDLGERTTGTDGKVALLVKPTVNTFYKVTYTAPDASTSSAADAIRRVNVSPAVGATLSRTSAPRGTSVKISTTVSPSHAGQQVVLQRYYSRAWHDALPATLSSSSTASWTFAKTAAGTYRYRVRMAADDDHVAGVSVTLTLTVT